MAHNLGVGIALPLHHRGTRRGDCVSARPGRTYPRESHGTYFTRGWASGISRLHLDFICTTVYLLFSCVYKFSHCDNNSPLGVKAQFVKGINRSEEDDWYSIIPRSVLGLGHFHSVASGNRARLGTCLCGALEGLLVQHPSKPHHKIHILAE